MLNALVVLVSTAGLFVSCAGERRCVRVVMCAVNGRFGTQAHSTDSGAAMHSSVGLNYLCVYSQPHLLLRRLFGVVDVLFCCCFELYRSFSSWLDRHASSSKYHRIMKKINKRFNRHSCIQDLSWTPIYY